MKILFVASEAFPFIKTGGLADVVGALAKALHQRGHDVRMVLPRYSLINTHRFRLLPLLPEIIVQYGEQEIVGSVARCSYPGVDMPVYFTEEPELFDRPGIYGHRNIDYIDNDRRFAFFNFAALWMLKGLGWQPDVIHLHDWQAGLLPALLKHHPVISNDDFYSNIQTVFSIHNLAYQGNFSKWLVPNCQLPWHVFTPDGMEFYDKASMLKSGLIFADRLTTVSPNYAREIQTPEYGAGMEGTLINRSQDLIGILNGIDEEVWNPATDEAIPAHYSAKKLTGKSTCKEHLQSAAGLPVREEVPVAAIMGRLVEAKGFGIFLKALPHLLKRDMQFILLASGEEALEKEFAEIAKDYRDKFSARIAYDEIFARQMIAGADIMLLPSQYEPCGLIQMYAMRYGTIPVARQTGGLADSITQANPSTIQNGSGTGFLFQGFTPEDLTEAVFAAEELYRRDSSAWKKLIQNAMGQDFSWDNAAAKYEEVYQ